MKTLTWTGAATLGEAVYNMVKEGKQQSPEFKALVKFFGRVKLLKLYEQEKEKKENECA